VKVKFDLGAIIFQILSNPAAQVELRVFKGGYSKADHGWWADPLLILNKKFFLLNGIVSIFLHAKRFQMATADRPRHHSQPTK
jgi:hypothetical protein